MLTAALVGDWVFSQRPRAVRDAVDLLLESRGLRMLIGGEASGPRHAAEVIVRDPAGRQRLIAVCKDLIGAGTTYRTSYGSRPQRAASEL